MIISKKRIYKTNKDCDLERLVEIARVNNVRINGGEESTIVLGHTSSEDPELLTIPVGHAENFVVEGEDLFCDFVIDDEWAGQITKYNKVSIELWADNVVTPIALLAKNRPALEVGLVKYQAPDREFDKQTYMLEEDILNMSTEELKQLLEETLTHSEFHAKICDLMENVIPKITEQVNKLEQTMEPLLAEAVPGEVPPEGEGVAEIPGEGEEKEVAEVESPEGEDEDEDIEEGEVDNIDEMKGEVPVEEEPEKNQEGMVSAEANNTYIPNLGEEEPKNLTGFKVKKKKEKYQAEHELVAKYQAQMLKSEQEKSELIEKMEIEKAELIKKYQLENRKNQLFELSKMYNFDPNDELNLVQSLDEEQFENHKKIIVNRYQKAPVGRTVNPVTSLEDKDVSKPDKVQKAIKLATFKGISFKEALDSLG